MSDQDPRNIRNYRKKPVVIQALQLLWTNWNEMCDFVAADQFGGGVYVGDDGCAKPDNATSGRIGLRIKTLEGTMLAVEGDYIIKGVKGEFYPCKPDIFAVTYERVDD